MTGRIGTGQMLDPAEGDVAESGRSYETTCFRALGHTFVVETNDEAVRDHLEGLFGAFAFGGPARARYSFRHWPTPSGEFYELRFDDEVLLASRRAGQTLDRLFWHINQRSVASVPGSVVLHAAAVERDGVAVVLPAPMESGKTTLSAGLTRAGMRYLTDEAVAIDRATLRIQAYPKPFSIDRGSWEVLSELRPHLPPGLGRYFANQWQVAPGAIRPDAVATSAQPGLVICPRYEPGATTVLEPMRRVDALRMMMQQTFRVTVDLRANLGVLAEVARRSSCHRLTVGDLGEACSLILHAVDEQAGRI